ncbi:MAG: efflux RND transporter periplasmic adaptor subunit [Methylotenera sp.]|nr:efflux RND transporter periplasmic adaptor subunit [Methylotenera sp.]MDO9234340.1 efflux RND transporter periplasmic adaptor subunit [Methylotenera sp.]MDO9390051.1 efflux RND transporter periplasmic adaptor subunit [Methylotenera sp.]MDP2101227.1 efflux RND transporter periplasmic adaptor subunit [Methylotenera sp.]MDP2280929.1 efflux RND transporter periplasmic adaptor subunit [Methylotenera sp.]
MTATSMFANTFSNALPSKKMFLALLTASFLMAGCNAKEEAPVEAKVVDPNIVEITEQLAKQIQLHTIGNIEMRGTLRVPGSIQVDEQRMARIGASVTGRIKDIEATLGQNVKNGQVLATLNSTELAQNQLVYIKASQQIGLQSKAVERARLLQEADVIGAAELQRREAELSAAQAELNAARDQLLVLGMSESAINKLTQTGQIRSYSNVVSRISGTVISRKVNLGQVVQPAEELFIIADLSHVWVVAEIPEQQIDLIQVGEEVVVEIPALGGKQYKAKLIYEGDVVNPETRTVTVRSDLTNDDREIKPDMLVSMLIQSHSESKLALPLQSIVRENDTTYVYVQLAPNKFRLREVELGQEHEGMVTIVNGVSEGEIVVADGAFHVNNERKRKELE